MVNTLTGMIADLSASLDIVLPELVGSCRLSPSTHAPPVLAVGQPSLSRSHRQLPSRTSRLA